MSRASLRDRLRGFLTSLRLGFAAPEPQLGPLYQYKRDRFTEMLGALWCWENLKGKPRPIDEGERYDLDQRTRDALARFQEKLTFAAAIADEPGAFKLLPEQYTYRGMMDICRRDLKLR